MPHPRIRNLFFLLTLLVLSQSLVGCLVLTPAARESATESEWPQAVHDIRWSEDGGKLTIEYSAYRQAPWGDQPRMRRTLVLREDDLRDVAMDLERVPAIFPGGGVSAEAMELESRMARCVLEAVSQDAFVLDSSQPYHYFMSWYSYDDVKGRLGSNEPVVLRPDGGTGNGPSLYSRVVVLVPGRNDKVYAAPLPDRDRSRAWFYISAPVLFVADVLLQPVWGITWVVNKLSFAKKAERQEELSRSRSANF
jgi:hypothetical protein